MGLDLPEGKVKYQDERVINLDKKFEAKKVTPFYAEFIKDDGQQCDGFIISRDRVWDLFIMDMEKLETRRDRATDEFEQQLITKCLEYLEKEVPLGEGDFSEEESDPLKDAGPPDLKTHRHCRGPA